MLTQAPLYLRKIIQSQVSVECFVLTGWKYQAFPEIACPGNDLGSIGASPKECSRICQVISDCMAFDYNRLKRRCWLKWKCVSRVHSAPVTAHL